MTKLRLFSLVAAIAIPMPARAQPAPAPAPADDIEMDDECDRVPTCMAEKLADALSGEPSEHAVQLDSLITFGGGTARVYSSGREKLEALARSWREHPRWSMITVWGYADARNNDALAQQRADKVRGYLIRYGVASGYVIAIGQDPRADDTPHRRVTAGRVDLTIALCDQASTDCRVKWLPGAPGAGTQ
jgi:outer membrane protein OmpA-like peptidoglycan-associated protein